MGFSARATPSVHPTAVVEEGAELGDGTRVWHHAHVMAGARIGAGCTLGKDVFVAAKAVVGDRVRIQNGVSVYDGVTLEDEVFVGPHAVFTNVECPRAFMDRRSELAPTIVRRGATIGAGAVIVCGHTVGQYAFVGAGAVVVADVPPHAMVVGNPARRIGWVSRVGRRLAPRADGVAHCPETQEAYFVEEGQCRMLTEGTISTIPIQDVRAETLHYEPQLRRAFDRVLASGHFILGPEVERLESEVAQHLGCAHAIAVSSGTDALLATLMALDLAPGDEVVTTPLSFFATAAAIVRAGGVPVFADVDAATLNLDPAAAAAAITPRTRAIVPVHLFGLPVDSALFDLAASRRVAVIEDAAQSFGARSERGAVGTLGRAGCFSFFPTKNLGALGDAGMIVTNDTAFAERLRTSRVQGARSKYNHVLIGGNFRMDALQAAFLREKLPFLSDLTARRQATARLYDAGLAEFEARGLLQLPLATPNHVYHHYVVRTSQRGALAEHTRQFGVETAVYYPKPLHRMPALVALQSVTPSLPHAETACEQSLALPIHPWLSARQTARVVESVRSFFSKF